MKESSNYLAKYAREIGQDTPWSNLPQAKLLRVEPRGDDARLVIEPPKKRGLVIALGWKNQMIIAFPYGNTGGNGYHSNSETYIDRAIGPSNIWTIMHGSIEKVDGKRTVFIYEMPERDKEMIQDVCHDLSTRENGTINPRHFLNSPGFIPERILQALHAEELRVVKGIASATLYGNIQRRR